MTMRVALWGRILWAASIAGSLVLATFVALALASLHQVTPPPFDNTPSTSIDKPPGRLVLHGVRFNRHSGQLDQGSKAVLDYAVYLLKEDPQMIVTAAPNPNGGPTSSCGLSQAQSQIVAAYIRKRGVSAERLRLCSAIPSSETR